MNSANRVLKSLGIILLLGMASANSFAADPGDINEDGSVNALDVQLVINAALGIDIGGLDADINGDGAVNALDVQLVINAALGIPITPAEYVGSSSCSTCHSVIYDAFMQSGHPYKLSKVEGGQPPTFPFSEVPDAPPGFAWGDMSYLIGGYGWKARFMDQGGYILTDFLEGDPRGPQLTQYNLATQEWVSYSPHEEGFKPYDCGACHTTGWEATGAEGPHQDGLAGIYGTWAEAGVQCEACHGPGSHHVERPSSSNMELDTSSELCGQCHFRDSQHRIAASGDAGSEFIRHHEQYDEMINGPHAVLTCGSCHDPHKGSHYEGLGGVIAACTDCHSDVTIDRPSMANLECTDCHMPFASKSAVSTGEGVHRQGDVKTHIFGINTDPAAEMFFEEGGGTFANGFLTLDFACLGCHNGTDAFELTEVNQALADVAEQIHQPQPAERTYVGSSSCSTCHRAIYDAFLQSGHPFKLSKVEGGQPPAFPFSEVPDAPPGFAWGDISYVLGGYGWKARFMDQDGYILTDFLEGDPRGPQLTQYNLATQEWVSYDQHADGVAPYDCAACHTTGWVATGAEGPHQDDLAGIYGTWAEAGVQCEACHGPGSLHAASMSADDIDVDTSSELCGQCHFRDSQHRIEASGDAGSEFILNHGQYDEVFNSPHAALTCGACHDPHKGSHYEGLGGVTVQCTDCHVNKTIDRLSMASLECTDCHMPLASKSAVSTGEGVHRQGDVNTHIFRINTDSEAEMFFEEGGGTFANGFLTLDFACLGCHDGDSAFRIDSLATAAAVAPLIHTD